MEIKFQGKSYSLLHPLILALVFLLVAIAIAALTSVTVKGQAPWLVAATALLLYTLTSAVRTLATENPAAHIRLSFMAFVGLLMILMLSCSALTGIRLADTDGYYALFVILFMANVLFLGIAAFIRNIYVWLSDDNH